MRTTSNFKIDVFGVNVTLIFTDDSDEKNLSIFKKLYKEYNESHPETENVEYEGAVFSPNINIYQYYLVFSTKYLTHGLIAHELEHLKNLIFENFGYVIRSGQEELPSTMAELLANKVYGIINKKGFKVL